eukprot:GHVT01050277.1.p1 GENE.GHVT01050277.1~~GHVT01050277.1.p1  ORF type:complete len:333 (-),score=43.24 GHVT01050277.1:1870-2868(-)
MYPTSELNSCVAVDVADSSGGASVARKFWVPPSSNYIHLPFFNDISMKLKKWANHAATNGGPAPRIIFYGPDAACCLKLQLAIGFINALHPTPPPPKTQTSSGSSANGVYPLVSNSPKAKPNDETVQNVDKACRTFEYMFFPNERCCRIESRLLNDPFQLQHLLNLINNQHSILHSTSSQRAGRISIFFKANQASTTRRNDSPAIKKEGKELGSGAGPVHSANDASRHPQEQLQKPQYPHKGLIFEYFDNLNWMSQRHLVRQLEKSPLSCVFLVTSLSKVVPRLCGVCYSVRTPMASTDELVQLVLKSIHDIIPNSLPRVRRSAQAVTSPKK